MTLTPDDLRAARYVTAEVLRSRRRPGGPPIPAWLRRLHDRLDAELQAMSDAGHENQPSGEELELISAEQAAEILGCSARQIRRLAADLGGRRAGKVWAFTRGEVSEYARARTER